MLLPLPWKVSYEGGTMVDGRNKKHFHTKSNPKKREEKNEGNGSVKVDG